MWNSFCTKAHAILFVLVAIPLTGAVTPLPAVPVQFTAQGKGLSAARITNYGRLIGFVGDFIEIKDGIHRLSVDAPKEYTLEFTVRVTAQQIAVIEKGSRAPNCEPELNVAWAAPTFHPHNKMEGVISAVLADPKFGAPTGRNNCSLGSLAACTTQKVVLTAKSDPPGAEIWIGGKRQPYRTNATLSVPYCEYEKTKDVLLRIPNLVNCQASIALAPDAKESIACSLQKPAL